MAQTDPVKCPQCGYIRRTTETAPAWQCPACGIAYRKHLQYLEKTKAAVAPRRVGDSAPHWKLDASVWTLIGANVVTVILAFFLHWSMGSIAIVYWAQSIIIGASYVSRILSLERFSTENFTINDRAVDPTPATKRQVAAFFAMHYGFFHLFYFGFIVASSRQPLFDLGFFACTLVFAFNHYWSYRYNRDLDRQGAPNIGTMMFTPYLRIIPMHLTMLLGSMAMDSTFGLFFFGALKTAADVIMHLVEHKALQKNTRDATATVATAGEQSEK